MSDSRRDTIFSVPAISEDFVFNERVVEVFDDMLDRSIPFYHEVISASAQLLARFLVDGDSVCDLGCANGTSLLEFARLLTDRQLSYIGIDNSPAMLDKARLKAELYKKDAVMHFEEGDITAFQRPNVGAVILNYTLQFIRPIQREDFLRKVFASLRPGGILLLSEKVISHDTRLNREFINIYYEFKKSRGYSELEIAKKREALENVLIPFSINENRELLMKCGFTSVESYFQWFNFTSFIAVKPA